MARKVKSFFGKLKFKTLIPLMILLIAVGIIVPAVRNSYAAANDWLGYTTDKYYDDTTGFTSGYVYVNLRKNTTDIAHSKISISHKASCDSGTHSCYKKLTRNSISYSFSSSNTTHVKVGKSSDSYKIGLHLKYGADKHYWYMQPTFQVKVPKGYKFDSYTVACDKKNVIGKENDCILTNPYKTGSRTKANDKMFTGDNKGPFASDTWVSGYLSISTNATGLTTDNSAVHKKRFYKTHQSLNIKFMPNTTTVKYNANGGSGSMENQTKTYDKALTLRANKFTRPNHIYNGWNTKANGTGTKYNNSASLAATSFPTGTSLTLYAQWIKLFNISYDANGGTGAPADQTQIQNSSITLSNTIPTRTGYIFNGWNTKQNGTGTNYDKGSTFKATGNITLYANWVKMPEKCDDWKGYTFSKTSFNNLGFNYGYACFNLAKNQSKYATTIVTVEPTSASHTNGTNDLFSELTNNQKSYTFTNSGNTDKVKVGESSATEYTAGKTSIIGETSTNFAYLNPTIKIVAPRGYKYDSANSFVAYNNLLYEEATALWPYKENSGDSSNRGLMSTNPGPYSQ